MALLVMTGRHDDTPVIPFFPPFPGFPSCLHPLLPRYPSLSVSCYLRHSLFPLFGVTFPPSHLY